MISRRTVLGVLAVGLPTLLSGCGIFSSRYNYRYKMVVEVDTPEGMRSGFAVHEQRVGKSNVDLGDISPKRGIRTRGEAVSVDLPNEQTLFVLMPDSKLAQATLDPDWKNDWVESAQRIMSRKTPSAPSQLISRENEGYFTNLTGFPLLVRFSDINNPRTVEVLDHGNLIRAFGQGYRLRRITLQLTDESITTGIDKKLNWLRNYINQSFFGERFSNPAGDIEHNLSAGHFSTEIAE